MNSSTSRTVWLNLRQSQMAFKMTSGGKRRQFSA